MFDAIAPRYDLVNRVMTFRLDVRWRRRTVRELALPAGSTVLDLASGTGDLCIDLRNAGYAPISIDLSFGMLAADHSGAPRVQGDILRLPVPDSSVDGVTCGFALRNLTDLSVFFDELARAVRPGGRIALLDVGVPHNKFIHWGNDIYFGKVVPKIGALLSDGAAYRYLPKSVAYLPKPDEMASMLHVAGFTRVLHQDLSRRPDPVADGDARDDRAHDAARVRPGSERRRRARRLPVRARGRRFAGRGVAARVPIDEAVEFLAAIEHEDEVGETTGPIALGALPFLPGAPATLVVPAVVVGKDDRGRAWVTRIDGADDPLASGVAAGAGGGRHTRCGRWSTSITTSPPSPPLATRCATAAWTRR